MNIADIEKQIENNLEWRESELASLKMILATSSPNSERQKAMLRACTSMLYAHYEGFCKFCWTIYLEAIQSLSHIRKELNQPLAITSLKQEFKRIRGDTADEKLWHFGQSKFNQLLEEVAVFPEDIDTESNLWPRLAKQINDDLCLGCPQLIANDALLRQLVARRNGITHGEKLVISDMKSFQQFEHAATIAMHELAVEVIDTLKDRRYLRKP